MRTTSPKSPKADCKEVFRTLSTEKIRFRLSASSFSAQRLLGEVADQDPRAVADRALGALLVAGPHHQARTMPAQRTSF